YRWMVTSTLRHLVPMYPKRREMRRGHGDRDRGHNIKASWSDSGSSKGLISVNETLLEIALRIQVSPTESTVTRVRMLAWGSLLLVAALILFSGSAFASGPNGVKTSSVAITVIDEKNQPVPDASVEVRSGDKSLSTSATDSAGKASLSLPGVGNYALVISKT